MKCSKVFLILPKLFSENSRNFLIFKPNSFAISTFLPNNISVSASSFTSTPPLGSINGGNRSSRFAGVLVFTSFCNPCSVLSGGGLGRAGLFNQENFSQQLSQSLLPPLFFSKYSHSRNHFACSIHGSSYHSQFFKPEHGMEWNGKWNGM